MARIKVSLDINEKLFLRDPQNTDLGRRILQYGLLLIDEVGFEQFTFRKLAARIGSTEASIYRYFENKNLLFIYLLNWYWEWMKFRIDFNTMNIDDPVKRLKVAIRIIVDTARRNTDIDFIDEDVLHRLVVSEGTKGYHTKSVDEKNKDGFFLSYKFLCMKIADIMLEISPDFPYPRTLASTLIETANNTLYFAEHLPRLTDITYEDHPSLSDRVIEMLEFLVFAGLEKEQTVIIQHNKTNYYEGNESIGYRDPGHSAQ